MKNGIIVKMSYALTSNAISLFLSLILSFFIPKILKVKEYGYWQLYSLYISYAGFFHFGLIDGIYLKLGGKDYGSIDFKLYKSILTVFFAVITIAGMFVSVLIFNSYIEESEKYVLSCSLISIILILLYTYFEMVLQATNRIETCSKIRIVFKTGYFFIVILFFSLGFKSFKSMIIADLISKLLILILIGKKGIQLVVTKGEYTKQLFNEVGSDIKIGLNLMLANIAGMLITGIVRFSIVKFWNIEVFGNISIALSIANLLFAFMSALSTVLFPALRNMNDKRRKELYFAMREILIVFLLAIIGLYYPCQVFVQQWLPQYGMGLKYMALLFPMVIFESKATLLTITYLNTLREERAVFKANCITVFFCFIVTFYTAGVLHSLGLTVASIVGLLALKSILLEKYLFKIWNYTDYKENLLEIFVSFLSMVIFWHFDNILGMFLYYCIIFLLLYITRKEIKESKNLVIKVIKE